MAKNCLFCKKELSKGNQGFLCEYHKELVKEKAKEYGKYGAVAGSAGALTLLLIHNPEAFMELAKNTITKITDNFD